MTGSAVACHLLRKSGWLEAHRALPTLTFSGPQVLRHVASSIFPRSRCVEADRSCSSKLFNCRCFEIPTTCPVQTWTIVALPGFLSSLMVWCRFARLTVSCGSVTVVLAVGWSIPVAAATLWRCPVLFSPRLVCSTMVDAGVGRAIVVVAPKVVVPRTTAVRMPIIVRSVLLEGLFPRGRVIPGRMFLNPTGTGGFVRCASSAKRASW